MLNSVKWGNLISTHSILRFKTWPHLGLSFGKRNEKNFQVLSKMWGIVTLDMEVSEIMYFRNTRQTSTCSGSYAHWCPALWPLQSCQAPLSMGFSRQRILEWVAISSCRDSSWPRIWTRVCLCLLHCTWILYHWATWEALKIFIMKHKFVYVFNEKTPPHPRRTY